MWCNGIFLCLFARVFCTVSAQGGDQTISSTENSDPSADLVVKYGGFQDDVTWVLKRVLHAGYTYFEVDLQSGYSFYKVAAHLEATGLAFGFVQSAHQFERISSLPRKSEYEALLGTGYLGFVFKDSQTTVDSVMDIVRESRPDFPQIVKVSSSDALLLKGSKLLGLELPLVYASHAYEVHSQQVIDMFVTHGYDVFWHISSVVIPNASHPLASHLLPALPVVSLIAVPMHFSPLLFRMIHGEINMTSLFFHFEPGKYLLSEYDVNYVYSTAMDMQTIADQDGAYHPEQVVTDISIVRGMDAVQQAIQQDPSKAVYHITQIGDHIPFDEGVRELFGIPPPPRTSPFSVPRTPPTCDHITLTVSVNDFLPHCPSDDVKINVASIVPPPAVISGDYNGPADVLVAGSPTDTPLYRLRFPVRLNQNALVGYLDYYCVRLVGPLEEYAHAVGPIRSTPDICRVHLEMLYREVMGEVQLHEEQGETSGAPEESRDALCSDMYSVEVQAKLQSENLSSGAESSPDDKVLRDFWFDEAPFQRNYEPYICSESLWCSYTEMFQERLTRWQNPPLKALATSERERAGCEGAKFIVFEPDASKHGIGSMLAQIAVVFRFALCHNRILHILPPQLTIHDDRIVRWAHPNCKSMSFIECYFRPVTSCHLSLEDMDQAPVLKDGRLMATRKFRDAKVVRLLQLPTEGHCTVCGSPWTGSLEFFDGLHVGVVGFVIQSGSEHTLLKILDEDTKNMTNIVAFMDRVKLPWMAQMIRYLLRPRVWFSRYVQQVIKYRIRCNTNGNVTNTHGKIPHPYASMHVRYGEKVIETENIPLEKYMAVLARKAPHIRNVYVSTETERVIGELARTYPSYHFYSLHQERHEFMVQMVENSNHIDFSSDFANSLTNLHIASRADFFVGTLSSSWCMMINFMQRTRGDGGWDYHSVDRGSSHSICF